MVGHPFRVPLYGQNGEACVGQSLNYIIPRTADRDQSFAETVYGLMVGGVYITTVSVELIKEIAAAQIAAIDIVELITSDPFVGVGGADVLCHIAAKMDVDELKALADAEHGLFLRHEMGKEPELQNVELGIHISGTVICLTEKGRGNVAAAGKKQMGGLLRVLGTEGGVVGDLQTFQGFFVVSGIFTAACYDYGGERGHETYSFCDEKRYFILCRRRRLA